MAQQGPTPSRTSLRRRQPAGRAATAWAIVWWVITGLVLLFALLTALLGGVGTALVVVGLYALLVGLGSLAVGHARWMGVRTRKVAVAVCGGAVVLTVVGGLLVEPPPSEDDSVAASAQDEAGSTATPAASSEPSTSPSASTTSTPAKSPAPAQPAPSTSARRTQPVDQATRLLNEAATGTALAALGELDVKGRAPKTGYDRDQFGQSWADVDHNGCDTRNDILRRDLTDEDTKPGTDGCVVLTGTLKDHYTGRTIAFQRGQDTSNDVQIDHVVALSDAWQKGAQQWGADQREAFANDPLNLLAVDGPTNGAKGDGDAATWLPPNTRYRCAYVARQVAVKAKYHAWVTAAERGAIAGVLSSCTDQLAPSTDSAAVPPRAEDPEPAPASEDQPAPQSGGGGSSSSDDLDCSDFASPAEAQATLDADPSDPNRLDSNDDGQACEVFDYGSTAGSEQVDPPDEPKVDDPPAPEDDTDPRFDTCTAAIAAGYGPYLVGVDPEYDWYTDADSDGDVCER